MTKRIIMDLLVSKKNKKRVEKVLLTKKGEVRVLIKKGITECRFKEHKIYTCSWKKNGGLYRLYDATDYVSQLLIAAGFKHSIKNDAPRGGAEGTYVQVYSKRAIDFLINLR